jgi:hypothetical protein
MGLLKDLFKGKDEPIRSYDDFWQWFARKEKTFFAAVRDHQNIEKSFFDKLSPKLGELKDGFYYLTGMFDDNTVELILTADGNIKNLVFVEELVARAPKISGWRFTAHKPEMSIENTNIWMDKYVFNRESLWFYSNDDPTRPDEIDITIVHRDFNEDDKSAIVTGIYLFLDNFLGELKSVTTIDSILVIGKNDAEQELVPIEKLKSFLEWREKEFVEKYHGIVKDTKDMQHSILEAETTNGGRLIAAINTDILSWESKASHPWILSIDIPYKGSNNGGLPKEEANQALWKLEETIAEQLRDEDGYILIGHESVDNLRNIYFACKDFRRPSKVIHQISLDEPEWKIDYKIYKDKYWASFNRFNPTR